MSVCVRSWFCPCYTSLFGKGKIVKILKFTIIANKVKFPSTPSRNVDFDFSQWPCVKDQSVSKQKNKNLCFIHDHKERGWGLVVRH